MKSFFARTMLAILFAVVLAWVGGSGVFLLVTMGPPSHQLDEVIEDQLELIASELEALPVADRRQRLHQLRPLLRGPLQLLPPGAPVPRDHNSTTLSDGSTLAAMPPPTRRLVEMGLALQGLFILVCASGVAWLLSAQVMRDLSALETAVARFRNDDLDARVPEPPGPVQPLAIEINHLASRVQALATSQRDLLHAVSHELRTPLARLRFHLEELADDADPAVVRAADEEIGELEDLIGELLDWMSTEAPVSELQDVKVQDVAERVASRHVHEHILLDIRVGSLVVRSTERDLERVLDNLVGNAMRYAQSIIRVGATPNPAGWTLTVEDDGPGFPPHPEHLLEPFATADEARTVGRSGLGLSIVQRIVERQRGHVTLGVSETLGGGCVTAMLP